MCYRICEECDGVNWVMHSSEVRFEDLQRFGECCVVLQHNEVDYGAVCLTAEAVEVVFVFEDDEGGSFLFVKGTAKGNAIAVLFKVIVIGEEIFDGYGLECRDVVLELC